MEDEKLFDQHSARHGIPINEVWFRKLAAEAMDAELKKTNYPFITISREAGAGGHALAVAIVKEMEKRRDEPFFREWQVFDDELCQLVMKDERLKVTMEFLMTEKFRSEAEDFWVGLRGNESPQYTIVKKVFECVRTLAKVGKVIIVGRGGACLTRDLKNGVHVRLVAPLPLRIKQVMEVRGISEAEAKKIVKEWDSSRAKLINTFFFRDIADPLLYDAVWNAGEVSMEMIAVSVLEMVRRKVSL